jgi:hypothetical protein
MPALFGTPGVVVPMELAARALSSRAFEQYDERVAAPRSCAGVKHCPHGLSTTRSVFTR